MSILDFVPEGWELRPEQVRLLLDIEKNWAVADIFSILAPTAVGKTLIALVVGLWRSAVGDKINVLVPENVLVDQGKERHPQFTVLARKDTYNCTSKEHPSDCDCGYQRARAEAKQAPVRLMNYWTYLANRIYAPVTIFDEGHKLIDMMNGMMDLSLRQSVYGFPSDLRTTGDLLAWIEQQPKDDRLEEARRKISLVDVTTLVIYKRQYLRGKPDLILSIEMCSVARATGILWPAGAVKKVILMSATISPEDIKELGLDQRRVVYLSCDSPILADRRPFLYEPAYNLSRDCVPYAMPALARKIEALLDRHPEKGMIHIPYSLATQLAGLTKHPRLLFHGKKDKAKVLATFRASDPAEGKVLVASGLYEGVDLPYDAARWQLIAKVPYLSLAEPRIAQQLETNPDGYDWQAIKRLLQAYGRIVRAIDDQGITYLCDTSFGGLWSRDQRRQQPLFPKHFRAAFKQIERSKV